MYCSWRRYLPSQAFFPKDENFPVPASSRLLLGESIERGGIYVRLVWLQHLPTLIMKDDSDLAKWVSPSYLITPCAFLPELQAWWKKAAIPDTRNIVIFGQEYMIAVLEPPNKLKGKQQSNSGKIHPNPFKDAANGIKSGGGHLPSFYSLDKSCCRNPFS